MCFGENFILCEKGFEALGEVVETIASKISTSVGTQRMRLAKRTGKSSLSA